MHLSPQQANYRKRIDRVVNYIYDHLDEEIDLLRLADVACMSPYHWHRVYRAIQGETIASTVKRLRLHRAAGQLAQTKISIEDIATRSGYSSVSAFTRAFSQNYKMAPSQFRRNGSHVHIQNAINEGESAFYPVEIKRLDPIHLLGVTHLGDYMEVGRAFDQIFGWVGQTGLTPQMRHSMATYYDDPDSVPKAELRSFAGVVLEGEVVVPDQFEMRHVAGGRYAVLDFQGPYADIPSAYRWLFGTWLSNSGEELRHEPCIEEYIDNPRLVEPSKLRSKIYMPLEDK